MFTLKTEQSTQDCDFFMLDYAIEGKLPHQKADNMYTIM